MNIKKTILTALVALLFSGCGGNTSGTLNNTSTNLDGSQSGSTTPIDAIEQDQNIIFSASFNDNSGILGNGRLLNYNNDSKSIEITVPFPLAAFIPQASGALPNHTNITFLTNPGDKTITLSIPAASYIELVENPTTLPNGRSLPGVNGGEPPTFGFPLSILGSDAYGYAAFDSFSIFIESSLNLPINLTIPIKSDQEGTQIGTVHWLASSNGESGGAFISVRLPKALSVLLANAQ